MVLDHVISICNSPVWALGEKTERCWKMTDDCKFNQVVVLAYVTVQDVVYLLYQINTASGHDMLP